MTMTETAELASGVYWLGARHPELKVFDELFPTRHGSTYNAYLVRGTDKIALIDTVKEPFTTQYLDKIRSLVPLERIDLVVINHTEPDHSGALGELLRQNPNITVYCTRPGENFLKQLFDQPMTTHIVADGEEIDLGGKTLKFFLAPNLHWPDTMFTYLPQDEILFPCDAFGAHFCGEGLYDDESSDFSADFAHYYDAIMRPFKKSILEAVAKVEELPLRLVCPSHGPLLRRAPRQAIASYRKWSTLPAADGKQVLILTISPHGNTRAMAAVVREGLEAEGLTVVEKSIYGTSDAELRDAMELADALVVASPTVNRDAPPPVWHALSLLSTVTPRGRQAAVFGSYGWSGEAIKLVEERLKGLKFTLVAPGLSFRFKPTAEDEQSCRAFGRTVGAAFAGHA